MSDNTVASVDANFENTLSLNADLGVVYERSTFDEVKISVSYYGNTATVTGVSTFDEFKALVLGKKQRVVLCESVLWEDKRNLNSYLYFLGDYYTKNPNSGRENQNLTFIGEVFTYNSITTGDIWIESKLVEINFNSSLSGTITDVLNAQKIPYSANMAKVNVTNVQQALNAIRDYKANMYAELSGTLTAGQTSITLSNHRIVADSVVDVYVPSDFIGVTPTAVSTTQGSVTLTFPAQSTNMNVKVRIS